MSFGFPFGGSDDDDPPDSGSMFGPKMGTWSVWSKKDPRWNGTGRAKGLVSLGGPPAIGRHIADCEEKYGPQPDDLMQSFDKD